MILADYKLEDLMCFQLYQASRTMTRLYKDILKPLELTYPQYIVMMLLWEEGNMSFSQISEKLQLKTGTLSPLLQRLEKEGWIKRKHNKLDDRVVEVVLGKKGLANKHIRDDVPCQIADMLGYDDNKYGSYMDVVKDINYHLHEVEEQ
jgi:DNA-binding Lrp family transcriptional regulator